MGGPLGTETPSFQSVVLSVGEVRSVTFIAQYIISDHSCDFSYPFVCVLREFVFCLASSLATH